MKCYPFRPRHGIQVTMRIVILLIFPLFSQAQTFVGVSSTPTDNNPQAGTAATVTPPASMVAGDLVDHLRSL